MDPDEWTEALAGRMAAGLGVTLTDEHWSVLRWARGDFEAHGASPNVRRIAAGSGVGTRRMYELFPKTPGSASFMRKKMTELDLPGVREMIHLLHESGCRMYGCELAMKMFGRTKADLLPEVSEVITATDFFEKTEGADIVFV